MTLPNLTSPTAELIAYRDELAGNIGQLTYEIETRQRRIEYLQDCAIEILTELNRRESCPHEDFTENLEGRTCRTCGLETK